jgi:hypothetical protein
MRQAATNGYGESKERCQDPMALVGGDLGMEGWQAIGKCCLW